MPPLSPEQTMRIAQLARLALTREELAALTQDLSAVLAHVERVNTVREPIPSVVQTLPGRYRDDLREASLSQRAAISPAAESARGHVIVPRVIE